MKKFLLPLFAVLLGVGLYIAHVRMQPPYPVAPAAPQQLTAVVVTDGPHKYPAYPHAVVKYGIHSLADLQAAQAAGLLPADLNVGAAKFGTMNHDVMMHVTFRAKDGTIHWSKNAVLIRAGEPVVTDGKYTLLLRCGNAIVGIVPGDAPVSDVPTDWDIPLLPVADLPNVPDAPLPPSAPMPPVFGSFPPPPQQPGPPPIVCCAGFPPSSPIPPSPPRHVTAASGDTFGVVVIAVLALILALAASKNRRG